MKIYLLIYNDNVKVIIKSAWSTPKLAKQALDVLEPEERFQHLIQSILLDPKV